MAIVVRPTQDDFGAMTHPNEGHDDAVPVFRGLQRPLEFMGLQGRYIHWAAGAAAGAILGFMVAYCLLGLLAGMVAFAVPAVTGTALILVKRRRGLHSKRTPRGIFVYANSRKP